jgi:hypothetical protein
MEGSIMIKRLTSFGLAMMLLVASSAHAGDPPPTQDDLKQLFDAGNYKELLPKLTKALAVKGADAAQYDRFQLLTMKGEASLRTHAKEAAGDAFKLAGAAATKPEDAATALGTAELIHQANGTLKYLPKVRASKTEKPEPIDIVDPTSRKQALAALETDMAAKVKQKVDAAIASASISQIVTAAQSKDLTDLKSVELAASGATPDTTQMLGDLGAKASSVMDGALDKMADELKSDVDATNNRFGSNAPVRAGAPNATMTITQFIQNMNTINNNAKTIEGCATSLKGILGDGTDLKPVLEKSSAVQAKAKDLLQQARKAGA